MYGLNAKGSLTLCEKNAHKLILTSLVVSVKYNDDEYWSNKYYAKVGGLETALLNKLETEFLTKSDWTFFVQQEEYEKYNRSILSWAMEPNDQS